MIVAEVGKASAATLQPVGPRLRCYVSTPSPLLTGPQNWRATEGFSPPWGHKQGGTCAPHPGQPGTGSRLTMRMLVFVCKGALMLERGSVEDEDKVYSPRLSCSTSK